MLKIYHNPRCKHSRNGLEYLKNKNIDFEICDYLKNGITKENLKEILLKSNLQPIDLVRKQEEIYKKKLKGLEFNNDEWIKIITENLKLLQRPIIVGKHKAVLANPPEEIDKLFK